MIKNWGGIIESGKDGEEANLELVICGGAVWRGKNAKEQLPPADLGHSAPERESTKDLGWKQAWSVQTIGRMPKWLEHREQGESRRRWVEKAKCTWQPRPPIIKEKDNSGPNTVQWYTKSLAE